MRATHAIRATVPLIVFLLACHQGSSPPTADAGDALADGRARDGGAGTDSQSVAQRLGFVGVFSLNKLQPQKTQELLSALGYSEAQYRDAVLGHMEQLGARMLRAHLWYTGGGKLELGELPALEQRGGFDVYACVSPAPPMEALDSGFEAALEQVVRSHPAVTHWQLGNEPDLLWRDHTRFPAFFIRAQPVIRKACPTCKILLAGISNQYNTSAESYRRYDGFLQEIAAASLEGKPFDIFDLHYYKESPSATEISQAVKDYRALLAAHGLDQGVELWCTETGLYTGDPDGGVFGPRTEREQARDLPRLVAWMSAEGIRRIYFWTLIEGWGSTGAALFDQMGLIYNGLGWEVQQGIAAGTKKRSYATFQLLARALADTTGAVRVAPGVYRFRGQAGARFIVWDEAGESVTLDGLLATKVEVTELVLDDQGKTTSQTLSTSGGKVTLAAGELPRLVVETP